MNKKIIIILLILILAILVGGFWFVRNQESNKEVLQEEIIIQDNNQNQQEPEIKEIDTSDWLTYQNEEYGFEVKYPNNWNYNNKDGITFNGNDCVQNELNECEVYINFSRYKEKGGSNKDVFEWRKYDFQNNKINNPEEATVEMNNIGYKVVKFSSENLNDTLVDSYYFIDDYKNGWEITIKYYDKKESRIESNTLKEILKTFRLLD